MYHVLEHFWFPWKVVPEIIRKDPKMKNAILVSGTFRIIPFPSQELWSGKTETLLMSPITFGINLSFDLHYSIVLKAHYIFLFIVYSRQIRTYSVAAYRAGHVGWARFFLIVKFRYIYDHFQLLWYVVEKLNNSFI